MGTAMAASPTSVGGTALSGMMTGLMTGGSPAKSSPPGNTAMAALLMMASTGIAMAHGSGRSAPATGGNPTTALTTAAGGTALRRMTIGAMTGGSPATSSLHGTSARSLMMASTG